MENASKALIMAGGILIALLVIGLLVFFYNNLTDLQSIKQSNNDAEAITEFNKKYEVYERNIYGSEILSLANLVDDYNKRESNNKGYTKLELYVTFETTINETYFEKNKTYTARQICEQIEKIQSEIDKYSSRNKNDGHIFYHKTTSKISRTTAQLASMRTNDIKNILGYEENERLPKEMTDDIQNYNNIKNLLTEIKSKIFKYEKYEYDSKTGRITKMTYKLAKL